MWFFLAGSLLFAALVAVIINRITYRSASPQSEIPGPRSFDPNLGNLPEIASAGSLKAYFENLHCQYGKIVQFHLGKDLVVSVADPVLLKRTLTLSSRPGALFSFVSDIFGDDNLQVRKKTAMLVLCFWKAPQPSLEQLFGSQRNLYSLSCKASGPATPRVSGYQTPLPAA